MQRASIYAHHSSKTKKSSIQRLSATDVSIKEEKEPCELHEKLLCLECQELMQEKMSHVLKRSVSYNAVNNTKRRNSVRNINRSLSQSSCYSAGSNMTAQLNNESFNEFLCFLSGEEYYSRVNSLWEHLPSETKDMFVAKALAKKKAIVNRDLSHNDVDILQSDSIPTSTTWRSKYRNTKSTDSRFGESSNDNNTNDLVDHLYNHEVAEEEKKALLAENLLLEEQASSIPEERDTCVGQMPDAQYLQEVKLWRDRQEITEKIKELTMLIEKFERYTVSPTTTKPSSKTKDGTPTSTGFSDRDLHQRGVLKHIEVTQRPTQVRDSIDSPVNPERPSQSQKKHNIIDRIARGSKKFVRNFKRKKRPAKLDIYRKPNPTLRVLVDPKNLQKLSRE